MFQSIAVRSQSIGTRALGHLAIRVMIFAALPKRIARVPTMPDSTPGGRALPVRPWRRHIRAAKPVLGDVGTSWKHRLHERRRREISVPEREGLRWRRRPGCRWRPKPDPLHAPAPVRQSQDSAAERACCHHRGPRIRSSPRLYPAYTFGLPLGQAPVEVVPHGMACDCRRVILDLLREGVSRAKRCVDILSRMALLLSSIGSVSPACALWAACARAPIQDAESAEEDREALAWPDRSIGYRINTMIIGSGTSATTAMRTNSNSIKFPSRQIKLQSIPKHAHKQLQQLQLAL